VDIIYYFSGFDNILSSSSRLDWDHRLELYILLLTIVKNYCNVDQTPRSLVTLDKASEVFDIG